MRQKLSTAVFSLLVFITGHAQHKIYGKITNTRLEPLAFVSVQLNGEGMGIISKEDGSYEFKVEDGVYEIIASMVGYKSILIKVVINKQDHQQNIIMEVDNGKDLAEVIVKGKLKDRSEEIIRQVIRHKDEIRDAAGNYATDLYIKAVQFDSSASRKKNKVISDSLRLNQDMMRMSMAEISIHLDHHADGRIKEERQGVKVRGNGYDLFYTSATQGNFNFYDNLIDVPSISSTPFLSPISYSGLVAYRYKMLKIEQRGTHKFYTISVKPGKLSNATVEGELTVADSSWTITHCRFSFPSYHLAAYTFFEVDQQHNLVDNKAWMITRQEFTYYSKNNRLNRSGNTTVTYHHFEFNKQYDKKYFGTELSKATAETYTRDSSFWEKVRTEPLSDKELQFIRFKDSVYNATHTKAYLDSIDRETNRVTWKKVLIGGQPIYDRDKERLWMLQPLVSFYQPFQFGGARIYPSINYQKTYKSRKNISLYANLSYGLRNKDVNGNISFSRLYNPFSRGYYRLSLKRDFEYIFEGDAWINMIKRSNQYLNNAFGIGHTIELLNGLQLTTDFELALRRSLANYKTNKNVDSLFGDLLDNNQAIPFQSYNASYAKIEFQYTPFQKYIREPKEKIILGSSWPSAYVSWRKGIPGFVNSTVDFNYLEFGLRQRLKLGLVGTSSYTIKTGSFLTRKDLRLVDYKFQRRGDPLLFLNPNEAFQSLDSTFPLFKRFYEGHYVHEFNGAILNKIPFLKKLQLREMAGGGFLIAPERDLRYAELMAGIERVFQAPFKIPQKFKLGVYIVGSVANQYRNPVQFKIGITSWDRRRGRWF